MATDITQVKEPLAAPIPVLSNSMILWMMEQKLIEIDPFDPAKLGPTAYRLSPHRLRLRNDDEDGLGPDEILVRLEGDRSRKLRPGEYVIVSPREKITLKEGVVADFYPSSWCAERHLILTAGRLDARYDADLVFGLFNAGRIDVELHDNLQIARASFAWLGEQNVPIYEGAVPGAYIPHLEKLRAREAELDSAQEALTKQMQEISKLREKLVLEKMAFE